MLCAQMASVSSLVLPDVRTAKKYLYFEVCTRVSKNKVLPEEVKILAE